MGTESSPGPGHRSDCARGSDACALGHDDEASAQFETGTPVVQGWHPLECGGLFDVSGGLVCGCCARVGKLVLAGRAVALDDFHCHSP